MNIEQPKDTHDVILLDEPETISFPPSNAHQQETIIPKSIADFGINDLYCNYHHLFSQPMQALSNFLCLSRPGLADAGGIMGKLLLVDSSDGL